MKSPRCHFASAGMLSQNGLKKELNCRCPTFTAWASKSWKPLFLSSIRMSCSQHASVFQRYLSLFHSLNRSNDQSQFLMKKLPQFR